MVSSIKDLFNGLVDYLYDGLKNNGYKTVTDTGEIVRRPIDANFLNTCRQLVKDFPPDGVNTVGVDKKKFSEFLDLPFKPGGKDATSTTLKC